MVTAIRVPFWLRALAVIVPVAPLKAPVPPVTVPWVTGPSDSLITPYRKPPLRSTATPIDVVFVFGLTENLSTS